MERLCCTHKVRGKHAVKGTAGREDPGAAACTGSEDTEQGDNHTGQLLRMMKVDSHGPYMGNDTAFDVQQGRLSMGVAQRAFLPY